MSVALSSRDVNPFCLFNHEGERGFSARTAQLTHTERRMFLWSTRAREQKGKKRKNKENKELKRDSNSNSSSSGSSGREDEDGRERASDASFDGSRLRKYTG